MAREGNMATVCAPASGLALSASGPGLMRITLRCPSVVRRCTQAEPPSGSQTLRHSAVSATTCTGRPRTR